MLRLSVSLIWSTERVFASIRAQVTPERRFGPLELGCCCLAADNNTPSCRTSGRLQSRCHHTTNSLAMCRMIRSLFYVLGCTERVDTSHTVRVGIPVVDEFFYFDEIGLLLSQ